MSQAKTFYCLRCQHRFPSQHDPKQVVERTCPACGSNSVRLETPAAVAAREEVTPTTVQGGARA